MGWVTFRGRHVYIPDAETGAVKHPVSGKTPAERFNQLSTDRASNTSGVKGGLSPAEKDEHIALGNHLRAQGKIDEEGKAHDGGSNASKEGSGAKGTPISHQEVRVGDVVSFDKKGSAGSKHSFTTQDTRHEKVTVSKVEQYYVYTHQKGSSTAVDAHFRDSMANIIRH